MPPGGIRTHDLSRRAAADLRLRPRGHWDRQFVGISWTNKGIDLINLFIMLEKVALGQVFPLVRRNFPVAVLHSRSVLMFHSSVIDTV